MSLGECAAELCKYELDPEGCKGVCLTHAGGVICTLISVRLTKSVMG